MRLTARLVKATARDQAVVYARRLNKVVYHEHYPLGSEGTINKDGSVSSILNTSKQERERNQCTIAEQPLLRLKMVLSPFFSTID